MKVRKNATSALISRERSSIRCSISGALVASISFSSSSVFMPPCPRRPRRRRRTTARTMRAQPTRRRSPCSRRRRQVGHRHGNFRRRCNRRGAERDRIGGRRCLRRRRRGRRDGGRIARRRRGRRGRARGVARRERVLDHLFQVGLEAARVERGVQRRRRLVELLLQIRHLGFAHRFLELALEFRRHAADLGHPEAELAQHGRQLFRADHDQRDHADQDELSPRDIEHRI